MMEQYVIEMQRDAHRDTVNRRYDRKDFEKIE